MSEVNTDNELVGTLSGASTLEGTLTIPERLTIQANKNITPTTSSQEVGPDTGYDAMAQVTVAAAPLDSTKYVTPTNTQQVIEPSEGKIGIRSVFVAAATDQFNTLMNREDSIYNMNVNMGTGKTCYGFSNGDQGYSLTITGGRGSNKSIGQKAFTYQKYLKSVTADEIKYMSNDNEFSYSGLTTGHFAALLDFTNTTFKGCTDIRHLYFGYDGVVGADGMLFGGRIFDGKSSGTVDIHVPADQLSAYQANTKWTEIISAEAAAGVTVNLVGDYE